MRFPGRRTLRAITSEIFESEIANTEVSRNEYFPTEMTNDAMSYVQCSSLVETSCACCNQEIHVHRSMPGAVVIITDFFFKRKINFQGGSDIIKIEKSHKNA